MISSKFPFIDSRICLTRALHSEPYADAESPRTRQMCLDHYDSYNLPIQAGDVEVSKALEKLRLYCRRQQPPDSQGA